MPNKPSQEQLYYQSVRRSAEGSLLFLDMVAEGTMTRTSLERLIAKRPQVYGRFAGFLKTLPD